MLELANSLSMEQSQQKQQVYFDRIAEEFDQHYATKKPAWNFTETLTRTVGLGNMFDPVEALKIDVSWGKTKIGTEVLGLVLSFKLGFVRTD